MSGPFSICDRSGFRFPANEMRREWNGNLVHKSYFERKHPQLEVWRNYDDPTPNPDAREDKNISVTLDPVRTIRFLWDAGVWDQNEDDTYRIALYSTELAETVTAYTTDNEISGTGYTAGGKILSGVSISNESFGVSLDADDPEWTAVTVSGVKSAMIYDDTVSDIAIAILHFEYGQSARNGTLTITLPPATEAWKAIVKDSL